MRKALNENPIVQVVMLGVLGIVVAFLFMTRVMGQDESGGSAAPAATPRRPPRRSVRADGRRAGCARRAGAGRDRAGTAPTVASAGFEAGAGLPASVVERLRARRRRRAARRQPRRAPRTAASRPRSATCAAAATPPSSSSRRRTSPSYSRIAEGVNLDRVPGAGRDRAQERHVEGELPAATISYGFRGPESVEQAIHDALYKGEELPYHPG